VQGLGVVLLGQQHVAQVQLVLAQVLQQLVVGGLEHGVGRGVAAQELVDVGVGQQVAGLHLHGRLQLRVGNHLAVVAGLLGQQLGAHHRVEHDLAVLLHLEHARLLAGFGPHALEGGARDGRAVDAGDHLGGLAAAADGQRVAEGGPDHAAPVRPMMPAVRLMMRRLCGRRVWTRSADRGHGYSWV
jgi:hypothetical protein